MLTSLINSAPHSFLSKENMKKLSIYKRFYVNEFEVLLGTLRLWNCQLKLSELQAMFLVSFLKDESHIINLTL